MATQGLKLQFGNPDTFTDVLDFGRALAIARLAKEWRRGNEARLRKILLQQLDRAPHHLAFRRAHMRDMRSGQSRDSNGRLLVPRILVEPGGDRGSAAAP